MSKREPELYILDILIAYDKLLRYTNKFNNGDDLLHSEMEWDATIRELEIIGEATKNLIQEKIIDNESRRIVDFRNQISHAYFGIDPDIVLDIIETKLPVFIQMLKDLQLNLTSAIKLSIKEHYHNPNTLKLLESIKETN